MSDTLASILRVHSTPGHRLAIDGPIILAVATSVDENWPLGLSAALHGLPELLVAAALVLMRMWSNSVQLCVGQQVTQALYLRDTGNFFKLLAAK